MARPYTGPKPIYIYALVDPRDGLIRYVGQSVDPEKRLAHHLTRYTSIRVWTWTSKLRRLGLKPQVVRLAQAVPGERADKLEEDVIAQYRATVVNYHGNPQRMPTAGSPYIERAA